MTVSMADAPDGRPSAARPADRRPPAARRPEGRPPEGRPPAARRPEILALGEAMIEFNQSAKDQPN
ncbi:hypothetical protein P3T22_000848 [Paraburkholderia sp. GAS348]